MDTEASKPITRTRRRKLLSGSTRPATASALRQQVTQALALTQVIAQAQQQLQALEAQLLTALSAQPGGQVTVPEGTAQLITPLGRSQTHIDPQDLLAKAPTREAFLRCVTVNITQTRQVLSQREFQALAKVTPGQPKAPVLLLTPKPVASASLSTGLSPAEGHARESRHAAG